jgi:hypothetical protein
MLPALSDHLYSMPKSYAATPMERRSGRLSAAAQRADLCLVMPDKMKGAILTKVSGKLVKLGLAREVRAKAGTPVWRRDDVGQSYALKLTAAGLKAITVDDGTDGAIARSDGKQFGLGLDDVEMLAQRLRDLLMQDLPPALEQAFVGGVADQSVLERVARGRRLAGLMPVLPQSRQHEASRVYDRYSRGLMAA